MTAALLKRATFCTSRLLDFFSEKELVAQTGHQRAAWPLVVLKELVDNAIDACEEAGIAPVVSVKVDGSGISVEDNGPGIPAETIRNVLDFSVRVSSREAYVSPTRGAQGNALKTILGMQFVIDGEHQVDPTNLHVLKRPPHRIEIESGTSRHLIEIKVDRIRQEPVISHEIERIKVRNGTLVRLGWPDLTSSDGNDGRQRFLQIGQDYAWINPHLTLSVDWRGETLRVEPTDPKWPKWLPSDPTSPHWYRPEHLDRLICGYLADGREKMTVRELVSQFAGLTGTGKQSAVLGATGLAREPLAGLKKGDGLDKAIVKKLLAAMKEQSKLIKPERLGVIGSEHFKRRFESVGCHLYSFEYRKMIGSGDGVPWVIETAFGWCEEETNRRLVTGVNWSPSIVNPFRELGGFGGLDALLSEQRLYADDPVVVALHMTCPRVEHTDRGKSAVVINEAQASSVIQAIKSVAKLWTKQRKQEERDHWAHLRRQDAMIRRRHVSVKDAAWEVMEDAYLKASANGKLPAKARQVMYAARDHIQERTGKALNDTYFTQQLLPDYVEENDVDWNVVYDARGHFLEPHTKLQVPLGTLQVRKYLEEIEAHEVTEPGRYEIRNKYYPTLGPKNAFGAILFIEKEGFHELFEAVKLAERYDLAIMSTKGMSVVASRKLIDTLAGEYDVPILVLHDFDKWGLSILGGLSHDTRRYEFVNEFNVTDLGLRLEDAIAEGLVSERVHYKGEDKSAVIGNLEDNGATAAEIAFLLERRVELNAFASDKFIDWIERKLKANGISKVVPEDKVITEAYRRMRRQAVVQDAVDLAVAKALQELGDEPCAVPDNLRIRVQKKLKTSSEKRWDDVLRGLADQDHEAQS